jgi:hypothetical protein
METIPHLGLIALALLLGSAIRWFWRAMRVNIPGSLIVYRGIWLAGLLLGGLAYYQNPSDPFAPSAMIIGLILVYLMFTGRQRMSGDAIAVGDNIPHFTAIDADNNSFDSDALEGKRILLKFFRGHW